MLKRLRKLFGRTDVEREPARPAPPPIRRGPRVVHRPIHESEIDSDAAKIVRRLTRFDHTAYLVGGCVRDLLLELSPKDFDIATTATPRQVKRLFSNCRIIGRRFRLAHVYFQNGKIIEVATFRAHDGAEGGADDEQAEGELLIRDDNVFGTPEEDALRRDFTINALFYDVNSGNVLDHTDGLDDLRRRLVRTIGDPEIRFREDPIRILRAVKFAARLEFEIESETLAALKKNRCLVPKAAPPRILEEINRFCRGGAARRSFELLRETGVFEVILPDFAEGYHEDPRAWSCLLDLLELMDERNRGGQETSTGEILAVLLLPLLRRRMGWQEDGVVQRQRGTDVRDMADVYLRPMAQRLRGPKRDQEQCRQILMTLHRMVPSRTVRRSTEQSILRRPCAPQCVWILEGVSRGLDGDVAHAARYWRDKVAERAASTPAGRSSKRPRAAAAEKPAGARRGRSRRSRRGRGADRGEERSASGAKTPPRDPNLPPPWDDSYFFAALPTAPKTSGEPESGDRYGTARVSEGAEERAKPEDRRAKDAGKGDGSEEGDETRRPRKRRRRRRRRTSSGSKAEKSSAGSSS